MLLLRRRRGLRVELVLLLRRMHEKSVPMSLQQRRRRLHFFRCNNRTAPLLSVCCVSVYLFVCLLVTRLFSILEQKRSGFFCLKRGKMHETMSDAAACRKSRKRRDADEGQSPLLQVRSLDCHRGCCHVPRRYIPLLSFTQMFHSFPFQRQRSSPTSHPTVSSDRGILPPRKERLSHRPDLLKARKIFFHPRRSKSSSSPLFFFPCGFIHPFSSENCIIHDAGTFKGLIRFWR